MYIIYGLIDNITGKYFYVGMSKDVGRRMKQHSQKFTNISFRFKILEDNLNYHQAIARERYWIVTISDLGNKLVNEVKTSPIIQGVKPVHEWKSVFKKGEKNLY